MHNVLALVGYFRLKALQLEAGVEALAGLSRLKALLHLLINQNQA